jgi:hypothetical protein
MIRGLFAAGLVVTTLLAVAPSAAQCRGRCASTPSSGAERMAERAERRAARWSGWPSAGRASRAMAARQSRDAAAAARGLPRLATGAPFKSS